MGRRVTLRTDCTTSAPSAKVGDEVAVHHVDVDGVDLRLLHPLHLLLQLAEIGGEEAGGDADGSHFR